MVLLIKSVCKNTSVRLHETWASLGVCVLTSLLGGYFHRVAGWTSKEVVGHDHEHLVFRVGHQVAEDARRLGHHAVETFGLLLLTDHQTRNQTGLTPVIQLEGKRGRSAEEGEIKPEKLSVLFLHQLCKITASLTLYSLNSPCTELRSTGFQCRFTLVLSTFDTRRPVGASVGSEHMKRDTVCVNSRKGSVLFMQESEQIPSVVERVLISRKHKILPGFSPKINVGVGLHKLISTYGPLQSIQWPH